MPTSDNSDNHFKTAKTFTDPNYTLTVQESAKIQMTVTTADTSLARAIAQKTGIKPSVNLQQGRSNYEFKLTEPNLAAASVTLQKAGLPGDAAKNAVRQITEVVNARTSEKEALDARIRAGIPKTPKRPLPPVTSMNVTGVGAAAKKAQSQGSWMNSPLVAAVAGALTGLLVASGAKLDDAAIAVSTVATAIGGLLAAGMLQKQSGKDQIGR